MHLPLADQLLAWHVGRRTRRDPVHPLARLKLSAVDRVLVVLTTGMGDAILSTPVLPALRRALPHARIHLFCRAPWAPLFKPDPDLNGVIAYAGKYRRFFATLHALRRFAPQLAVVLHGNDPDILPLCYLAGSRFIVRIPTQGTRYAFLLSNAGRETDRAPVPGWHYIENRLRVLDTLGIAPAGAAPRIHLDEAARQRTAQVIARDTGGAPYWVMHPFAADAYKVWPLAKARQCLERMRILRPGLQVLLTGGPRDRQAADALCEGLSGVHNFAGRLDIAGTAALLTGALCVVAPDTGVAHLAAALDVPVIALFAPTSAKLIGPRAARAPTVLLQKPQTCDPCVEKRCPYTPKNCMDQIGVDEVLDALAGALR